MTHDDHIDGQQRDDAQADDTATDATATAATATEAAATEATAVEAVVTDSTAATSDPAPITPIASGTASIEAMPIEPAAAAAAAHAPEVDSSAGTIPPAFSRKRRWRRVVGFGAAAALLVGIGAGGTWVLDHAQASGTTNGTSSTQQWQQSNGGSSSQSGSGQQQYGSGQNGSSQNGWSQFGDSQGGSSSGSSTATTSGTKATSKQKTGVVTIVSTLKYESATSAGTGVILTSDGEILTNNHVIEGATSITVTVESTGKSYTATVVGTDATHDIAVLKLKGASGLTAAKLATTAAKVGDSVTAVGNAGGTGTLYAVSGKVTKTNTTITTQAEGSTASETLSGMIETDADVVAGDSGGPLVNSSGEVVGITTAATSGTSDTDGYVIPISKALDIASSILAGEKSSDIVIGYPAFLGVEVAATSGRSAYGEAGSSTSTTSGATVQAVISGTPAAKAGIVAGDVITKVDGHTIDSASALTSRLKQYEPGDRVTITYTDTSGSSHTVTVTLVEGPAA